MFQEKGEIVIEKADRDEDEMMMMALDAGAEDFNADEVFVVITTPEDFSTVREALEANGISFLEAEVKQIPDTYTAIDEETAKKMQKC